MELQMKLAVGCDVAGYDFKCGLIDSLRQRGYRVTDVGCDSCHEGIYPYYAERVAKEVLSGRCERGILICGTGQGMMMAANKIPGIRAALCTEIFTAIMSREHNNSNVLCLGAWVLEDVQRALPIVEAWLFGKYSGRHDDKLALLEKLSRGETLEDEEAQA